MLISWIHHILQIIDAYFFDKSVFFFTFSTIKTVFNYIFPPSSVLSRLFSTSFTCFSMSFFLLSSNISIHLVNSLFCFFGFWKFLPFRNLSLAWCRIWKKSYSSTIIKMGYVLQNLLLLKINWRTYKAKSRRKTESIWWLFYFLF